MSENNKTEENKSDIYYVTFEDYLKPKLLHKSQKLQQFHALNINQEARLPIKTVDLPTLKTKKINPKLSVQSQNKNNKINNRFGLNKEIFKPKKIFRGFLQFFYPRQDDGICKRKSGFEIYCELASVHGFVNFIHANFWQRIFWSFIICCAIVMCLIITLMSHLMEQRNPTIFYTEGITYPAWNVPFPALTFCNLNRISKSEAEKVAYKFENQSSISRDEILQLFSLALYASHETNGSQRDFLALELLLKRNNYTIEQLLYEISPKCEPDEYRFCKVMGHFEHCKRLISEVRTVVGVCCAFNFLALKNSKLYNNNVYYSVSVGYETGLKILINPNVDNYTLSTHTFSGYTFFLHDAFDAIDGLSSKHYLLAQTESYVGVTPSSSYGTRYLRARSVQSRRCYFSDERKLVTFRQYSQTNCIMECRSLLMYEKCGCLPTFWPKINNTWNYCQLAVEIKCVLTNKEIFSQMMVDGKSHPPQNHDQYDIICDCLPSCDTNKYTSVVESAPLDRNYTLVQKRFFKQLRRKGKHILVHVFYEDIISERYRLDVSETWLSFLGTFGGIAGLYMGYSFVSGFEVIFFVLIRPACNWLTKKKIQYRLGKRQRGVNKQKLENKPPH